MKRSMKALLLLAAGIALFYVTIFFCIRYKTDKVVQDDVLYSTEIKDIIKSETNGLSEKEIIKWCRQYTCRHLSFSLKAAANNINDPKEHKEHCVGYSAFFSAVLNFAFQCNNIDCRCIHARGRMFIAGIDLHSFFVDRNFKNHDYCIIESRNRKERIIDISIIDLLIPTISF